MKDKLINDLRKVDKYLREIDQTLVITNSSYTGKLNINQHQLEQRILEIWSTFKVTYEKQHLWNRQMEIIEFYKGMGWNYETSRIKELFER